VTNKKALIGTVAPNIDYPGDPPRPVGFGPIAPAWLPRRTLAGTYDAAWEERRKPLVPDDFDDRFYQAAPEDQQARGYLIGGEEVELRNLTPSGPLSFCLPKVALGFRTQFVRAPENHIGNIHTVLIEPDQKRLIMVWHTAVPCEHRLYTLKGATVFLKQWLTGPVRDGQRVLYIGAPVPRRTR
jgi:hypothetical protein